MDNILIFNPNDPTVAYRATQYITGGNGADYTSDPNALINPDMSSVSGISMQYWKVDSTSVVEMSTQEKAEVDSIINATLIKDKNFKLETYDPTNRKILETWYATDNGDGTYKDKVEETTFTYQSGTAVLLYKTVAVYYADGSEVSSTRYSYYKNSMGQIIEKKS